MKRKTTLLCSAVLCLFGPSVTLAASDTDYFSVFKKDQTEAPRTYSQTELKSIKPVPMPPLSKHDEQLLRQWQEEGPRPAVDIPSDLKGNLVIGVPHRANVTVEPFLRVGRLVMFYSANKSATCTAQFAGADDVIITAAHCVKPRTGGKAESLEFYRAYDNGGGEQFGWDCYAVKSGWDNTHNRQWDYAFVKLDRPGSVGFFGFKTTLPADFSSLGYPVNFDDGEILQTVEGKYGGSPGGGINIMDDNPMREGSSGGTWYNNSDQVYGLNGGPGGSANQVVGPVIDQEVVNLFNYVNNGCK